MTLAHIQEQLRLRLESYVRPRMTEELKEIGWAVSHRVKPDLAIRSLNMATVFRAPPKDGIHHTYRGSHYSSHDYQKILRQQGFKLSMSGKGNYYDNAPVATFFKAIKAEMVIFKFVIGFYNPRRRQSALEWKSPAAFERKVALTSTGGGPKRDRSKTRTATT